MGQHKHHKRRRHPRPAALDEGDVEDVVLAREVGRRERRVLDVRLARVVVGRCAGFGGEEAEERAEEEDGGVEREEGEFAGGGEVGGVAAGGGGGGGGVVVGGLLGFSAGGGGGMLGVVLGWGGWIVGEGTGRGCLAMMASALEVRK